MHWLSPTLVRSKICHLLQLAAVAFTTNVLPLSPIWLRNRSCPRTWHQTTCFRRARRWNLSFRAACLARRTWLLPSRSAVMLVSMVIPPASSRPATGATAAATTAVAVEATHLTAAMTATEATLGAGQVAAAVLRAKPPPERQALVNEGRGGLHEPPRVPSPAVLRRQRAWVRAVGHSTNSSRCGSQSTPTSMPHLSENR